VEAARQGLAEIDLGERIPTEEIERELPSWVIVVLFPLGDFARLP